MTIFFHVYSLSSNKYLDRVTQAIKPQQYLLDDNKYLPA